MKDLAYGAQACEQKKGIFIRYSEREKKKVQGKIYVKYETYTRFGSVKNLKTEITTVATNIFIFKIWLATTKCLPTSDLDQG